MITEKKKAFDQSPQLHTIEEGSMAQGHCEFHPPHFIMPLIHESNLNQLLTSSELPEMHQNPELHDEEWALSYKNHKY